MENNKADNKTILIFEAHSDDAIIGMAGTIAKFKHELGYRVVLITFTKGETAYSTPELKDKIAEIRKSESQCADKILGIDVHEFWEEPTQGVVNTRALHQSCIAAIRKYRPEIIFTHYKEDKHRDHRAISDMVTEAWWKASEGVLTDRGAPFRAEKLYYFEVTEAFTHPDVILDITAFWGKKEKALKCFGSQEAVMGKFMKAIEGLNLYRGFLAGFDKGEAFLKSDFFPFLNL